MPRKKQDTVTQVEIEQDVEQQTEQEPEPPMDLLSSKQEVADELKMSLYQLDKLLQRYPFEVSGVPPKVRGRWRVYRQDVHRWYRYVQRQELRHPDARRLRPEEPPELAGLKGR
jgi:hypothetical protein